MRDPFAVTATRPDVRSVGSDPSRRSPSTVTVFVWPVRSLAAGSDPARRRRPAPRRFHRSTRSASTSRCSPGHRTGEGRPGPAQVPTADHPPPARRRGRHAVRDGQRHEHRRVADRPAARTGRRRRRGPRRLEGSAHPDQPGGTRSRARPLGLRRAVSAQQVEIEASFGATADVGGGSYDRRATLVSAADPVEVGSPGPKVRTRWPSLADAVSAARQSLVGAPSSTTSSSTAALELVLAPGVDIVIQAADATRPALGGGVTVRALDGPASMSAQRPRHRWRRRHHRRGGAAAPHPLYGARRRAKGGRRRRRPALPRRRRPQLLRPDPAGRRHRDRGVEQRDRRRRRSRARRGGVDRADGQPGPLDHPPAGHRARSGPGRGVGGHRVCVHRRGHGRAPADRGRSGSATCLRARARRRGNAASPISRRRDRAAPMRLDGCGRSSCRSSSVIPATRC